MSDESIPLTDASRIMAGEYTDQVVVVTGGASGIGAGIARAFRAAGATVVIADVEPKALVRAATEIGATGIVTDVRDADAVQRLADETIARFGRVDVIVNNAGIGPFADIAQMQLSDWRWIVDVNLWGVIHGVHSFLPLLERNAGGGMILNTASLGGLAVVPGLGAYGVTKFGVVALTEALAAELEASGSRVRAAVLVPGTVSTNIQASSRNRPTDLPGGALKDVDLRQTPAGRERRWITPDEAGRLTLAGLRAGETYIVTHPESWPRIAARHDRVREAFERAGDSLGTNTVGTRQYPTEGPR